MNEELRPAGSIDTLDEANYALLAIRDDLRFERRRGRLWFANRYGARAVVSGSTGWYPAFDYGALGMGGTQAGAVMQLARWVRGLPRVPLSTWEYWCGPKIRLAGPELVDRLRASTYPDPTKTCCVLCGGDRVSDWWSLDDVVGPCCWGGRCRDTKGIAS